MSFLPADWLTQLTAQLTPALAAIFPVVVLVGGISLGAAIIEFIIMLIGGEPPAINYVEDMREYDDDDPVFEIERNVLTENARRQRKEQANKTIREFLN